MSTEGCTLPPDPASVPAARRFAGSVLAAWELHDAAWTCLLLVSELTTNAVIHARTEFTVELHRVAERLRVCVVDASPLAPAVRRYGGDATTGRGLRLLESVATAWGVEPEGAGKSVWFELDIAHPGSARSWDDGGEVELDVGPPALGDEALDGAASAPRPDRPGAARSAA